MYVWVLYYLTKLFDFNGLQTIACTILHKCVYPIS